MTPTMTLPLWLYIILLALAALEWLLLPSVRWYFRRRVDRVIRELNVRLNIAIPQFKRVNREELDGLHYYVNSIAHRVHRAGGA